MSEVLGKREDALCDSVSLGGGVLNMVTEYSEMAADRAVWLLIPCPAFLTFLTFHPILSPATVEGCLTLL